MSSRTPLADQPAHERMLLCAAGGVSVTDFRCHALPGPEGPDEPSPTHSIAFVRRGAFSRSRPRERESVLADANHILFFNRGQPYRYAHPAPSGDACTILAIETSLALALVSHHEPRRAECVEEPFRLGHAINSPRVIGLHYELLHLARVGPPSPLALEEICVELAAEALRAAYREDEQRRDVGVEAAAASRRSDLVEATKGLLLRRVESPPGLDQLARAVDCSSFHLSRTFREVTGITLRRYAKRLRACLAADRLAAGERNLTSLALDLGYADHSHFTNAFRQELGMTPSRFRSRFRSQL